MSKKNSKGGQTLGDALRSVFTLGALVVAFIISLLIFIYVMGNPINFEGGNPAGHPLPGNYLAIIYKGGWIVPLLMTVVLIMFTFTIERGITITRAKGKGRINVFVKQLQEYLNEG